MNGRRMYYKRILTFRNNRPRLLPQTCPTENSHGESRHRRDLNAMAFYVTWENRRGRLHAGKLDSGIIRKVRELVSRLTTPRAPTRVSATRGFNYYILIEIRLFVLIGRFKASLVSARHPCSRKKLIGWWEIGKGWIRRNGNLLKKKKWEGKQGRGSN